MAQFIEFATNHWDLFLALFVVLGLLIYPMLNQRLRGFSDLTPMEAVGLMNHQDAVLVDVRENGEYAGGHVPDSMHLPLSTLATDVGRLEPLRGKPIIVGCRSGARSSRAAGILRKQGFEPVHNLRGGILAWENAGLPLTKGGGKKKKRKGAQA